MDDYGCRRQVHRSSLTIILAELSAASYLPYSAGISSSEPEELNDAQSYGAPCTACSSLICLSYLVTEC